MQSSRKCLQKPFCSAIIRLRWASLQVSAHILQNLLLWWNLHAAPRGCVFFCSKAVPGAELRGFFYAALTDGLLRRKIIVRLYAKCLVGSRRHRKARQANHRIGYTCAACSRTLDSNHACERYANRCASGRTARIAVTRSSTYRIAWAAILTAVKAKSRVRSYFMLSSCAASLCPLPAGRALRKGR